MRHHIQLGGTVNHEMFAVINVCILTNQDLLLPLMFANLLYILAKFTHIICTLTFADFQYLPVQVTLIWLVVIHLQLCCSQSTYTFLCAIMSTAP